MPGALDCGSEPVAADDTFDGTALDRCRWNVVNEVRAGYRVAGGKLEIDARAGDLSGGTTSAENVILQKTPQADSTWTAETTVAVDGTDDYIQSGLVAYGNGQNYGKLVVMNHPDNGWVVELGKITGGALGYSPVQKLPIGANTTGVRLKLISDGEALRGQYSVDGGTTWVNVGEQPDGYLGLVGAASGDLRALVNSINIQRKSAYTQKATASGATVEQLAFTSGCNLIAQTGAGEKYKAPDGAWKTRTAAAPDRDPRCV
jgi:uncharacterized protein YdbL (DUF1318 family)